jgi:TorA maturation chaperone TorD
VSEIVINAENEATLWKGRSYLYGILATILNRPDEMDWIQGLFDPLEAVTTELGLSDRVQRLVLELKTFYQSSSSDQVDDWLHVARQEYDRLFIVPIKDQMVPLGASVYLHNEEVLDERRLKWEGWYFKFGFEWRELFRDSLGIWPNEPEHAALTLPMLSMIADEVSLSRMNQDEFFNELQVVYRDMMRLSHDWFPDCFKAILEASNHPIYTLLAALGMEFFELDWRYLV